MVPRILDNENISFAHNEMQSLAFTAFILHLLQRRGTVWDFDFHICLVLCITLGKLTGDAVEVPVACPCSLCADNVKFFLDSLVQTFNHEGRKGIYSDGLPL